MLKATSSGCINHPGVEAVTRCKQCGRPVCGACVESGPTGHFCSTDCRDKHQAFYVRAQQLEGKARGSGFIKVKKLITWLITAAVVCAVLGLISTLYYIPVLSDLTARIRAIIGI